MHTQDENHISTAGILRIAAPLILTMSGHMLMQFVDALFLSWLSPHAVAAAVPAGMAAWVVLSPFHVTAGFTATLVAHYEGAGRPAKVASTVWQGLYFALAAGILIACLAPLGRPLFDWVGHEPGIRDMEVAYFRILCLGALVSILGSAASGFFIGRGRTRTILGSQLAGAAVNGLLDYALIFGHWGFPRWGIAGAAVATVAAQTVIWLIVFGLLFRARYRARYGTWARRAFDPGLFARLVRFGFPSGLRHVGEMSAWTLFLFFVGRIGAMELAATNIAWRINGIAFFPIIGLSQAVGVLVGNAQGRKRPDQSVRITYRGLAMAEVWMIAAALAFVCFPAPLIRLFWNPASMSSGDFDNLLRISVVLLRLVALYCLLDAFNIVLVSSLQSAGDTRWTLWMSVAAHSAFIAVLFVEDARGMGLMVEWVTATVFVIALGFVWLWRFHSGQWRHIEVIERFEDVAPPVQTGPDGLAPF